MLTRIVAPIVTVAGALLPAAAAAGEGRPPDVPPGPPLMTGGHHTSVLHCNALDFPRFVGAVVVNPNGEFAGCRFVPPHAGSPHGADEPGA